MEAVDAYLSMDQEALGTWGDEAASPPFCALNGSRGLQVLEQTQCFLGHDGGVLSGDLISASRLLDIRQVDASPEGPVFRATEPNRTPSICYC